jgi:hypothetical protein
MSDPAEFFYIKPSIYHFYHKMRDDAGVGGLTHDLEYNPYVTVAIDVTSSGAP